MNGHTEEPDPFAAFFTGHPESELKAEREAIAQEPPILALPTIADVLASMPPPVDRYQTGLPSLDTASRGGFAPGKVYSLVGPPGRGKTALLAQFGLRWARTRSATVIGIFVDEGSWQAAVMMAQGLGFPRSQVENDFPAIQPEFSQSSDKLKIFLPHPDDPATCLAKIPDWLSLIPKSSQPVLLLDSIQTIRIDQKGAKLPMTEQAEKVMTALRLFARAYNPIILAASMANRASYATKDKTDALASAYGGAQIEHGSDALIFLDGDPQSDEGVTLAVQKNRPGDGSKPKIRTTWNRAKAEFSESDWIESKDSKSNAKSAEHQKAVSRAADQAEAAIRKSHPARLSINQLHQLIGGKKENIRSALAGLQQTKVLDWIEGPRGALLWGLNSSN